MRDLWLFSKDYTNFTDLQKQILYEGILQHNFYLHSGDEDGSEIFWFYHRELGIEAMLHPNSIHLLSYDAKSHLQTQQIGISLQTQFPFLINR